MTVDAIKARYEHGHLLGDIPALAFVAVALAVLTPRRAAAEAARTAA